MTRRRILLFIAAIAVGVSACGGADVVASVNGVPIERDELLAIRADSADRATLDAETARIDLGNLILLEVFRQAAQEQFGLEVSDTDIDGRIANPPAAYANLFASMAADPSVATSVVRTQAELTLVRDAVIQELILDEYGSFGAYLDANPGQVVRVCARHIVTDSQLAALDARNRIDAGEEFLAVAAEVSLDPTPGAQVTPIDLCPIGVLAISPEFADAAVTAPIGEVGGPLPLGEFFQLFIIDDRTLPTAGEIEADPLMWLDPDVVSARFSSWLTDAVSQEDLVIDVDSQIGEWSYTADAIAPSE